MTFDPLPFVIPLSQLIDLLLAVKVVRILKLIKLKKLFLWGFYDREAIFDLLFRPFSLGFFGLLFGFIIRFFYELDFLGGRFNSIFVIF